MTLKSVFLLFALTTLTVNVFAQINCPANLPLTLMGNTDYCIGSLGAELSVNETYHGYEWLPTAENNQSALLAAGNYQVVVTHYTGCTDTLAFEVNQVSNPPQPTIDISGPTQFCLGENVVLSVPTWYPYYEWNTGSVSDELTVYESGTYVVSIEDWIGCSSSSNSVQIVVDPLPTAAFSPNLSLFDIEFNNLSYDATDYEWNFGDGATSTDFEPTHTYNTGGALSMYLVAANNCGTDTAFLELQSVGIQEQLKVDRLSIYPNPSDGNFSVKMGESNNTFSELSIYNSQGQMVHYESIQTQNAKAVALTNELDAGVYLLTVQTEGILYSKRLVIQR